MSTVLRLSFFILMSLLTILNMPGCSSNDLMGDDITDITLTIEITPEVNPDDTGRPSPVVLNIHEMKTGGNFRPANYIALFQNPEKQLGKDLINSTRIGPLVPGTTQTEKLKLDPATIRVGILGELNNYQKAKTMTAFDVVPGKDRKIKLIIDGNGLELSGIKPLL